MGDFVSASGYLAAWNSLRNECLPNIDIIYKILLAAERDEAPAPSGVNTRNGWVAITFGGRGTVLVDPDGALHYSGDYETFGFLEDLS